MVIGRGEDEKVVRSARTNLLRKRGWVIKVRFSKMFNPNDGRFK
jgi:hypothetical protein